MLQSVITGHNKKVIKNLQNLQDTTEKICKCGEEPCVLEDGCGSKNIVYQATVTQNSGKVDTYVGLSSTPFFMRYKNHQKSFRHEKYKNETRLSSFVWELKSQNINFEISWKVIDRGKTYCPVMRECQLCLKEKYVIIFKPEISSLNKRSELASNCQHKQLSLLANLK